MKSIFSRTIAAALALLFAASPVWAAGRDGRIPRGTSGSQMIESNGAARGDSVSSRVRPADSAERAKPRRKLSPEELEALRKAAERAASAKARPAGEEAGFRAKGLGLQALNPEISVSGDFRNAYRESSGEEEFTDFEFREFGIHLQSYLDPYSRFKASLPVSQEGVELEEAYFTRFALPAGIAFTLGKFKEQFGVVNRWHEHSLDWVDYPLPLRSMLGVEGLNQVGMALEMNGGMGWFSTGIQLEVTSADNEILFDANRKKRPADLAHVKLFRDLTPATYLEVGLTGLIGWNDAWPAGEREVRRTLHSALMGADLTVLWEPPGRMRYRNVVWRSELYMGDKRVLDPDDRAEETLDPWGFYSSVTTKLARTLELSLRFDYYEPAFERSGAADGPPSDPLVIDLEDGHRWQFVSNLTWWQSPFVKFRLEYQHEDGKWYAPREDRVLFQCVFAAGPHKHERY